MLVSCDPPVQENKKEQPDPMTEQLVKANKYMQQRHRDHIAAFIERAGWNAKETESGLWMVIKKQGNGKKIKEKSRVTYSFNSRLLDGTPCYSASKESPMVITLGAGGVESGVEQGLLMLNEGGEATLLIPPHLAHGNFGDRNRIPGNSVLIYSLKVLEVQ